MLLFVNEELTHPILHHTTHYHRHQLMVDVGVIDDEGRICLKLKNCGDDKLMSRLESDPVAHLIVEQVREVALVEVSAAEELL